MYYRKTFHPVYLISWKPKNIRVIVQCLHRIYKFYTHNGVCCADHKMCIIFQNSRHVARLEMYTYIFMHFSGKGFSSLFSPPPHSVASVSMAKNMPPLQRKGKLESHVLYCILCTGQDCQKYPSTKCTRMYIFLFHEKVKNT